MGCGGSKQDVATGNTTATQCPSRRKPGAKNKKLDAIPEMVAAANGDGDGDGAKKGTVEKPASENTKPPLSDVKDIRVNTEGKCDDNGVDSCKGVVDQGGGGVVTGGEKTVARESPDRYFSSRKDDEESVVGGNLEGEYFSPDRVAVVAREEEGGKAEAEVEVEEKVLEGNAKDGARATANVEDCKKEEPLEEKVLVDGGRVEEVTPSDKEESADLEKPIVIEVTSTVAIIDKRNIGEDKI